MSNPNFLFRSWLAVTLVAVVYGAQAKDLQVVAPNAVKESLAEIAVRFEKDTGRGVSASPGVARRPSPNGLPRARCSM